VVFYSAIIDGLTSVLASSIILFNLTIFRDLIPYEKVLLTVIWILLSYAIAISVPTVIDRSLSFYILEKIEQRGGGIRKDAFEQVFITEYMTEHHLVDIRLTEQLESGTIDVKNECVLITDKGRAITKFSRYFRENWLPQKRLLLNEYTNELTTPFKNSIQRVDYQCGSGY
jgi:hypothetical protein